MSKSLQKHSNINNLKPFSFLVVQVAGWFLGNIFAYNAMVYSSYRSFLVSSSLMLFLLLTTTLVVRTATAKKSIALFRAAIVLKWPIVILAIWWLLKDISLDGTALALGAMLWVLPALVSVLVNRDSNKVT